MTYVHIYRAEPQPATRFVLDMFENRPPMIFRNKSGKLLTCSSCFRKRRAKDMVAYAYYDGIDYHCREKEHGRSREFPFAYGEVCKGTAFKRR